IFPQTDGGRRCAGLMWRPARGARPLSGHSFEVSGRAASSHRGHQWPVALHRLVEGSGVNPP
ncbi:unnamed protein product, partial [Urochloa humidicola]